jgi:hypothetical protein
VPTAILALDITLFGGSRKGRHFWLLERQRLLPKTDGPALGPGR